MKDDIYRQLCATMKSRGGMYPGADIPEFYELVEVLFSPEEAAVSVSMPRGFHSAEEIARRMKKEIAWTARLLEAMADGGLCFSLNKNGTKLYAGPPFMPGIFEYQFMRGTQSARDRKLARLIRDYKSAVDATQSIENAFPAMRVIPVNKTLPVSNQVHTYEAVKHYIDAYEPLSVSTCYCRHQAKLLDASDHCTKPDDVCLQFGSGAAFVIERGMGKPVTKAQALEILDRAEDAGLVHCTNNRQEIDFLCNCCSCHCVILKRAKMHPKPGLAVNSGFRPVFNPDLCEFCEICVERCPMNAIDMRTDNQPAVNLDFCIGCGLCASGCPAGAVEMHARREIAAPPINRKALKKAIRNSRRPA